MSVDSQAAKRARLSLGGDRPAVEPTKAKAIEWIEESNKWEVVDNNGDHHLAGLLQVLWSQRARPDPLRGGVLVGSARLERLAVALSTLVPSFAPRKTEVAVLVKVASVTGDQYWVAYKGSRILLGGPSEPIEWVEMLGIFLGGPPFSIAINPAGTEVSIAGAIDTFEGYSEVKMESTITLAEATPIRLWLSGDLLFENPGPNANIEISAEIVSTVNYPDLALDASGVTIEPINYAAFRADPPSWSRSLVKETTPFVLTYTEPPSTDSFEVFSSPTASGPRILPAGEYTLLLTVAAGVDEGDLPPAGENFFNWDLTLHVELGATSVFTDDVHETLSFGKRWHAGVIGATSMVYTSQGTDISSAAAPSVVSVSPDDWRGERLTYAPLPAAQTSCTGLYRDNLFSNIFRGKVYSIDPDQLVPDGTSGPAPLKSVMLTSVTRAVVTVKAARNNSAGSCVVPPNGRNVSVTIPAVLAGALATVLPEDAEVVAIAVRD
ncbi:MAG: hypothetical protein HC771_22950 [Synechococcales cyanobacterium CRU_2_2]|nr:hypothetical protein [Synechococcales cyanobacterium CRU_2_2]